ncbi:unnamed protein product [Phytomonas sp. Hart1]|nr:unnamed protein product [Phytomonas sp. Hart1]|eukprot:CCW70289.1 unnamed protein product [Phytomonas sp. isolate Hart1]
MSHKISASQNGSFLCGSTFLGCITESMQCTFSYVHPNTNGDSFDLVSPVYTAFSRHMSTRSSRGMNKKGTSINKKDYKAGDHAALCYNNSGSFFSILILRCDTWSVQWAVASLQESMSICKIELLDAHLLCGLASTNSNVHRVFIASRLNCKYVSEKENRSLRHFLAQSQFIKLGVESENIITITAARANSIIILTELGSLCLVKIEFSFNVRELNWSITEKAIITDKLRCVSKGTEMIFSTNGDCNTLVVYSQEISTLNIISFSTNYENPNGTISQINIPENFQLRWVEFVGPYHFVMALEECSSHTSAFQFVSFFTSADNTLEFVQHEVVPLKKVPVVSFYNAKTEEHVVVCANMANWSSILKEKMSIDLLIHNKFSFANGPYSKIETTAVWKPFYIGHDNYQDSLTLENATDNLNDALSLVAPEDTNPTTSLRLFYPLLNSTESGSCEVSVFSVETLPYLHNRLVKQFHNATQGLRHLLSTRHPIMHPFLFSWNPRHLRRALRLLSQEQLGALFHDIAETMRHAASGSVLAASNYGELSTAGCSIAMQIITLSKQIGVVLDNKDVEILSALFRSSREVSHDYLGYLSRMKLILESCTQQRRINNLLYTRQDVTKVPENQEVDSTPNEFSPVFNNSYSNPGLQTKYDMNSWANNLKIHMPQHIKVAEAAMQHITDAYDFTSSRKDKILSDWEFLGREPNFDATFNRFESTLMGTAFEREMTDDK